MNNVLPTNANNVNANVNVAQNIMINPNTIIQ